MIVLITGANGFVGSALCREFLSRRYDVVALVRAGAETRLIPVEAAIVRGEFHDRAAISEILSAEKPDVVVHAAAVVSSGRPNLEKSLEINVEGTRVLAEEARRAGVERFVLISSMSAHPDNKSIYGGTKLLSEKSVRESSVPYTMLRPSLVYGPQRRGIFHKLTRMMAALPIVPLIGMAREPLRPVHVDDLAWAAAQSVESPGALGKTIEIGGADAMTFREMLTIMRQDLGKPSLYLPMPLPFCRLAALVGESFLNEPPITSDNIEGIHYARPVCIDAARELLGYAPRGFREGFKACLEQGLVEGKKTPAPPPPPVPAPAD